MSFPDKLENKLKKIQQEPPEKKRRLQIITVGVLLIIILIIWFISFKFKASKFFPESLNFQNSLFEKIYQKKEKTENLLKDLNSIKNKTQSEAKKLLEDEEIQEKLEQTMENDSKETPEQTVPEETSGQADNEENNSLNENVQEEGTEDSRQKTVA